MTGSTYVGWEGGKNIWLALDLSSDPVHGIDKMGRAKRKGIFEHGSEIHTHACTKSIRSHLFSIDTFYGIQGDDQTVRMRRPIFAFAVRICRKSRFLMARPKYNWR